MVQGGLIDFVVYPQEILITIDSKKIFLNISHWIRIVLIHHLKIFHQFRDITYKSCKCCMITKGKTKIILFCVLHIRLFIYYQIAPQFFQLIVVNRESGMSRVYKRLISGPNPLHWDTFAFIVLSSECSFSCLTWNIRWVICGSKKGTYSNLNGIFFTPHITLLDRCHATTCKYTTLRNNRISLKMIGAIFVETLRIQNLLLHLILFVSI